MFHRTVVGAARHHNSVKSLISALAPAAVRASEQPSVARWLQGRDFSLASDNPRSDEQCNGEERRTAKGETRKRIGARRRFRHDDGGSGTLTGWRTSTENVERQSMSEKRKRAVFSRLRPPRASFCPLAAKVNKPLESKCGSPLSNSNSFKIQQSERSLELHADAQSLTASAGRRENRRATGRPSILALACGRSTPLSSSGFDNLREAGHAACRLSAVSQCGHLSQAMGDVRSIAHDRFVSDLIV